MTLSIITPSITTFNTVLLSVANKPIMLSVFMLSVIMLSVFLLSVFMLIVVAPTKSPRY